MMKPDSNAQTINPSWKNLYTIGGIAALIAGILFRRNLGVEIALFSTQKQPADVVDWFSLLQSNRLLGLTYLNFFDVVNYALVGLMFLALYAALRQFSKSGMAVAAVSGLMGIAVYFATNTAFSMLSLSAQYTAADEAQRSMIQGAGQALLAINRFSTGAQPGAGGYLSLLFVASASLIISIVMLRSKVFNRASGIVGLLASGLDLAYCLAYVFQPGVDPNVLAVSFIPAAGLFYMVWHILVGVRLIKLGRKSFVGEEIPS